MSVTIRSMRREDVPRVIELIDGLLTYEHLPLPDAEARRRLERDAFADPPLFWVLLADVDGTTVGYAFYFFTYSTLLARPTLYLEDIFVLPEFRGQGAGLALFKACVAEAVRRECGRMDWQVLSWNEPSIRFYEKLGAQHLSDWLPFRLDVAALAALDSSA